MLDGSVARYFHSESEFGSRLDSLADFIFFAISCFKILPNLKITCVFMIWALSSGLYTLGLIIAKTEVII